MKKTFSTILAFTVVLCCIFIPIAITTGCSSAAVQTESTPATNSAVTPQTKNTPTGNTTTQTPTTNDNATTLPAPIALQNLAFDVNVNEPQLPWPIMRLGYTIYTDHPFHFEATDTTDSLTGKPINWTPVEPVKLYQLADGSWNSTAPNDIPGGKLQARQFYLVEPGRYYRIIASFGSRTQNITDQRFYPSAKYSLDNVYSGLLKAGRTGCISLELNEYINDVCIIHRCQAYIASVKGVKLMPKAYASNANGDIIITYYPATAADRKDYYTDANVDLILPEQTIPIKVYNLLY